MPSSLDSKLSNDELYELSVRDAAFADDDEIMPLVNISKDDDRVIWDGDKVLVTITHKYPDSYPAGEEVELKWGDAWCVSAGEMYNWVKESEGVTDWTERFHQVLGVPTSKNYNTVTALWVDPGVLNRPAYVTDITAPMTNTYQPTGNE